MGDFEFVVTDETGASRGFVFPGPNFVIGSGPQAHLTFTTGGLLPRHAQVMFDNVGQPWVRDLTGKGLVWVNGEARPESPIPAGTFLRLGTLELVVRQRVAHAGPSGTVSVPTPLRTSQPARPPSGARPAPPSVRTSGVARPATPARAVSDSTVNDLGFDATSRRPTPFGPKSAAGPTTGADAASLTTLPAGLIIHEKYKVVGKLAAGGMGEVYRAEHVELGKPMALKVMRHELSRDPEFVARFKREAVAASRIGQQNIVDISDFGQTHDGRFFFVMEFLDGITLSSAVHRGGAMPVERAVSVILQVARALAAAHAQGIVHRDLKPENVMLLQRPGQPDFVKVLDFGVAKVSQGRGEGGHTAVGMVVGTPQYMSPEQAKAIPVDARSDIYSLGLILYELIAGRPTFTGETPSILMVKHVTEAPPPLSEGALEAVPFELERLVSRMLEKEPGARPQTMEEVVVELDSLSARLRSGDPTLRSQQGGPVLATPAAPSSGVAVRVSGGYRNVVSSGSHAGLQQRTPAPALSTELPEAEPQLPPRSRLPLVLGGVALLGLLGGGSYFALRPASPPATPAVPGESVAVKPTEPTPAEVKPAEPKPAPPVAPAEPAVEQVKLSIDTQPSHAEVYDGDVMLGVTPLSLQRAANEVVEFRFALAGFKPLRKKIAFSSEQTLSFALQKEAAAPRRPAPNAPKGDLAPDPYADDPPLKDLE